MEDISTLEECIDLLRKQIPIPDEEIKEVEVELTATRRLLQRHGVFEKIQKLKLTTAGGIVVLAYCIVYDC